MSNVLFFFHIPKTAGQTIRKALSKQLGLGKRYLHLGPYGYINTKDFQLHNKLRSDDIKVVQGHDLRISHAQFIGDKTADYAIMLRNPIDRLISQYTHYVSIETPKKPLEFWDWYYSPIDFDYFFKLDKIKAWHLHKNEIINIASQKYLSSYENNYMAKFILIISGRRDLLHSDEKNIRNVVLNILSGFAHVGCVENISVTATFLEQYLNTTIQFGHHNKTKTSKLEISDTDKNKLRHLNSLDFYIYNTLLNAQT